MVLDVLRYIKDFFNDRTVDYRFDFFLFIQGLFFFTFILCESVFSYFSCENIIG